jgi:hypothetical protein
MKCRCSGDERYGVGRALFPALAAPACWKRSWTPRGGVREGGVRRRLRRRQAVRRVPFRPSRRRRATDVAFHSRGASGAAAHQPPGVPARQARPCNPSFALAVGVEAHPAAVGPHRSRSVRLVVDGVDGPFGLSATGAEATGHKFAPNCASIDRGTATADRRYPPKEEPRLLRLHAFPSTVLVSLVLAAVANGGWKWH